MERWITPEDYTTLDFSLKADKFHTTTKPEFYYAPGSFCKVYEDDKGPIMYVRGTKSLRVDIQFVDNNDFERNRKTLTEDFPAFADACRRGGFTEIVFNTTSPLLKRFCKQKLKFDDVEGDELRFFL
jgi:hypothetical protein